jgi:hypothetical protein
MSTNHSNRDPRSARARRRNVNIKKDNRSAQPAPVVPNPSGIDVSYVLTASEQTTLQALFPHKTFNFKNKIKSNLHPIYSTVVTVTARKVRNIVGFNHNLALSRRSRAHIALLTHPGDVVWKQIAATTMTSKHKRFYTNPFIPQRTLGEKELVLFLPGELEQLGSNGLDQMFQYYSTVQALIFEPKFGSNSYFGGEIEIERGVNSTIVKLSGYPDVVNYNQWYFGNETYTYTKELVCNGLFLYTFYVKQHVNNITTIQTVPPKQLDSMSLVIKSAVTLDSTGKFFTYTRSGVDLRVPLDALLSGLKLFSGRQLTDKLFHTLHSHFVRNITSPGSELSLLEQLNASGEASLWVNYLILHHDERGVQDRLTNYNSKFLDVVNLRTVSLNPMSYIEGHLKRIRRIVSLFRFYFILLCILDLCSWLFLDISLETIVIRPLMVLLQLPAVCWVIYKVALSRLRFKKLIIIALIVSMMVGPEPVLAIFSTLIFGNMSSLIPPVSCGIGVTMFIPTMLLLLITMLCVYVSSAKKHINWKHFKEHVISYRQTIHINCTIPRGATLPDFESLIDVSVYPMNPRAWLAIKEAIPRLEARDAVTPIGVIFACKAPIVHSTSQHNLICALKTRALCYVEPGSAKAWNILDAVLRDRTIPIVDSGGYPDYAGPLVIYCGSNFKAHGIVEWKEYVIRFKPTKRDRLNLEREKFLLEGVKYRDFEYETFIKREKIMSLSHSTFVPIRPRVIQGCANITKVIAGPWFLNYSYALKAAWNPTNEVWYCSGHTSDMYDAWVNDAILHCGGVNNILCFGSDFSKYDVTQGPECIKREYDWYKKLGFLKLPWGKRILGLKKKYIGRGLGILYQMIATRKSGENDTSSGNSKTTADVIRSYLYILGVKFKMAVLGDDNFTILDMRTLHKTTQQLSDGLRLWATNLGFSLKIQMSRLVHQVEFLSSRFYPINGVYHLGKKAGRVLTKIGWMLQKQGRDFDENVKYMKGTLISLLPVANHVPFLRVYIQEFLNVLSGVETKIDMDEYVYKDYLNGKCFEPALDTFNAFYEVYGLSEEEEDVFRKELKVCFNHYPYLLDSEYVDQMAKVDDEM